MTTFSDFNLNPSILKSLEQEGYANPTPIQTQAIPGVLSGRDLLGIAQTGTGKTAAFALPILHRLMANKVAPQKRGCRVLVLTPTRELATQIADSFRIYGRHLGIKVGTVFGGVGHRPQIETLARGLDVLVATPGRLLDHLEERNADLDGVETFVLDEADQMLDMGFIQPIRRIISHMPAKKQTLFFSATMPKEIGKLASELLHDPVRVSVAPAATTVERVKQHVYLVDSNAKRSLLVELFANPELTRTIVFTRTKRGADKVARHLDQAGISVASIHGNKSQGQRQAALSAFKASKVRALVATDVAARGIDIDLVTHVVNFELPNVPESYVHRIGRTARAGAEGMAISLCDAEERDFLRDIERLTRQTIPATDRRRDKTLEIEPARESRSENGNGRREGKPRGGRPQQGRRPEQRSSDRDQRSAGNGHRHNGNRTGAPRNGEQRDAGQRDGRPHQHRPERREHRAEHAHGSSNGNRGENGASLAGIAFMAAPSRGGHATRRDEHRGSNGQGHGQGQKRSHGTRPQRHDGPGKGGQRQSAHAGQRGR